MKDFNRKGRTEEICMTGPIKAYKLCQYHEQDTKKVLKYELRSTCEAEGMVLPNNLSLSELR